MITLMANQTIRPFEFRGRTFDCGSLAGFVSANGTCPRRLAAFVNMEIEALTTARRAVA